MFYKYCKLRDLLEVRWVQGELLGVFKIILEKIGNIDKRVFIGYRDREMFRGEIEFGDQKEIEYMKLK